MYRGIEKFQKDHGLKVDQVANPGGPTEKALNQALDHPSVRNGGRYDPNQPRDWHGRWTASGGGGGRKSLLHHAAGEEGKPWTKYSNADFRQAFAEWEGSANQPNHGYGVVNRSSGALGRYQLMKASFQQIGWQDRAGNWTPKAAKHGVRSKEDFRNSPDAQEAAFSAYMRDVERQAETLDLYRHVGTTYTGVQGEQITITEAGIAAAGHRRGVPSTAKYLAKREGWGNTKDRILDDADKQIETRLRKGMKEKYTRGDW
jgi:hypothetical protein